MERIYLGTTNEEAEALKDRLNKLLPNSRILLVPTPEKIQQVLQTDFDLLIVSSTVLDLANLPDLPNGKVIFIGHVELAEKKEKNIKIYNDIGALSRELIYIKERLLDKQTMFNDGKKEKTDIGSKENEIVEDDGIQQPLPAVEQIDFDYIENNDCQPVILEEYPALHDSNASGYAAVSQIINMHYKYGKRQGNRIIGFWSPLDNHQTVLHILINLAIHLAKYNIDVAVLETITSRPKLKAKLVQYNSQPENWVSVMHPVFSKEEYSPENARWRYRNVDWHPISKEILEGVTWKTKDVETYLLTLMNCNIGLVDLQFDEMSVANKYALEYLDELWIFLDNRLYESMEWASYIHDLEENYRLKIHLIFIKGCSRKRADMIAEKLGYRYLTIFPSLEQEIEKNEEMNIPLIDYKPFERKIFLSFSDLTDYIFSDDKTISGFRRKIKKFFRRM